MDGWLEGCDRSELYSDEGPPFGTLGIRSWNPEDAEEFRIWLLRLN